MECSILESLKELIIAFVGGLVVGGFSFYFVSSKISIKQKSEGNSSPNIGRDATNNKFEKK